ncbi:FKBP-type peptidylprolyl isomerase [Echinicola strongylocentroti]|uniref:Peptidyl-prolyl cis-trans isomerase n=1 Tax=Echinicola strongylocentroti TaxID=1795355 RepID=A0A2Z4IJ44_9BACT|nr:FKBP-type peptidyl-prolyl cis-trans isomerase [Echinicola strongylocentroti]AWW30548.1 FKBP-type peptidylprolyl isomerase [Echinicola strongylocentroti]
MKKLVIGLMAAIVGIAAFSCEPNNPYDFGPQYDFEGNMETDSLKIAAYLDTAQIDSLYRIHDPSGTVIIVQEEGNASRPNYGNVIYTNYVGKLMEDGTVFDTNIESEAIENDLHEEGDEYGPYDFQLVAPGQQSEVILGWQYGFSHLRSGSKAVLVIPSPLAYQDQEKGLIPANSILIYNVEFLGMD